MISFFFIVIPFLSYQIKPIAEKRWKYHLRYFHHSYYSINSSNCSL
nr:MAG TPA: hypothetical protein [Caudoviricetes sp.]